MMTINTLYELARNSVEKFASKVAFSMYEGDDVTYAVLPGCRKSLPERGFVPGTRWPC